MKIKRRTLKLIIIWTAICMTVGVVSGLSYFYFGTSTFSITTYHISGVDEETSKLLNQKLHDLGDTKMLSIVPANKIITYNRSGIQQIVRDTVPEMATLHIRPIGINTLRLEITLLTPLFRVSETQALTEDGIIFTTKYPLSKYPKIVIASSTVLSVRSHGVPFSKLVSPETIENKAFLHDLSALVAKISSVVFPVDTVYVEATGDVLCVDERGVSKVIFLKDSDFKKTWSTLVSSVDTDPLKTKLTANKEQLEYLDVRFGNKVFYRFSDMAFQNGNVTGILDNHATATNTPSETVTGQGN
jgi:hypothetical protein